MSKLDYTSIAREVLSLEAEAIEALRQRLGTEFEVSVDAILRSSGRVIVCGMGKSGIIGRKIAATLASTGTPAFFMHPGEAYHGDLGMVTPTDIFLAISNSGETKEVVKLLAFLRSNGNYLIAMTGNAESTLARAARSHLDVGVEREACPFQLAPTSSTTASLALGDALAITLMRARDFRPEHFARFHPGGSLGRRLLATVDDEMVTENLPFVDENTKAIEVFRAMTQGRLGLAIVRRGNSWGIITDGDIRRAIERFGDQLFARRAADIMSIDPVMIPRGTRVEDALDLMQRHSIGALLVSQDGGIVGVFRK
ncbi:KpsF/GutQ family sugar-phosphate isomerase [Paraburkholderia bannensis]|uniref:Arabinose-5-phosphate isomerase n=1 Tax=Paraburkholderia tropica TaxID=92647 RepID=A0AAQ1JXC0_9BURK|nr:MULTISPECIES: KpsF/GutQ family sugar-phosphate isomerase [Paraburkholderia]QNB12249.1 KpsF/GutQ family sugar-phosphate isomerase [Paraburkholderia tropica]RQM49609.1 KpsF/GutQ family sugar-phosphate isomerase [Paraburkholderia bannensis]RQN36678.1 KpsF/GutQ family sugar-phosphate isomerase [Paraburkholderia tropica]SEK11588.1 arabinose-5-phosphate isomerase [Paraburkholderia tropica]